MTDINGLKIGETKMPIIGIVTREAQLRAMFEESREHINRVFKHEQIYKDLMLACLVSRSKIGLEGYRGCGKSYLMDAVKELIKPARTDEDGNPIKMQMGNREITEPVVWRVQSYLDADIEDTMVRPFIPALMRGDEELIWKPATRARVKLFDEIQRLGIKALSVMFGMMDSGKVYYLEQEEGVYPFWAIFTMNPTETAEDNLNFAIPEPLIDRFDAMMWIPRAKMEYASQIKTQEEMRDLLKTIPHIWGEKDLIDMWKKVDSIPIPDEQHGMITLSCRIISFCLFAQDYDATSLGIEKKRQLCSNCNHNYFCFKIVRPPSIRAEQSWKQLAKGFAYIRGHDKVQSEDIASAFAPVLWRRIRLLDEDDLEKKENADRLALFNKLQTDLLKEIGEGKETFDLISELKNKYDETKFSKLEKAVNSKAWVKEQVDSLNNYYERTRTKLSIKMDEARKNKDSELASMAWLAGKSILPPNLIQYDILPFKMKMKITPEFLADLTAANKDLWESLRDESGKTITLDDKIAASLVKLKLDKKIKFDSEILWT